MAKRGSNQLDDMQIRRWVADGKPTAKTDGGGLTFTLSKAGTATWVLRYMRDSKAKELTIGNYPDITLAAARKLASKRRVEIDGGLDPAAMKRTERLKSRAAWLVGALIDDYSVKNLTLEQYAEDTIYYREWDFKKIVRPKLGAMEVRAVSPADIVHMLETSKRSWAIQKRLLTSVSKLFDHAVGKQIIPINPCAGIKLTAMLGPKPPVKKRVMLSEQDLRALLSGIDDIGAENALAFRVMLATCVRTVELVKARWEHVDFVAGTWYVPDDSVKTRQGFLVPITPTVGAWFQRLKELSDGSEWVLPARTARRAASVWDAPRCGPPSPGRSNVETSTCSVSPRMTRAAPPRATCATWAYQKIFRKSP